MVCINKNAFKFNPILSAEKIWVSEWILIAGTNKTTWHKNKVVLLPATDQIRLTGSLVPDQAVRQILHQQAAGGHQLQVRNRFNDRHALVDRAEVIPLVPL